MTHPYQTRTRPTWNAQAGLPPAAANRKRSPLEILGDPKLRLGLGLTAMVITSVAARRKHVGPVEAAAFRAVNELPDSLYPPVWVIMQLGTLGAAPAAAEGAWLAGNRELAGRLLAGGSATWALSKLVKRLVRRPRPAAMLPGARGRGRDATGLGYLSGHAGVAVALGTAVLPHLGPAGRAVAVCLIPAVGLSRIYVGAHLPLDTVGGAALGLAVDAAVALARQRLREPAPTAHGGELMRDAERARLAAEARPRRAGAGRE
jgi:glycosyltransferase 2 family protein